MTDQPEPTAPPRGVKEITLFDRRTDTDTSTETVTLERKGDLLIAGRDLGETPKKFWGKPEYEYWRRIDKADVPRVLLGLIKERFDSHASFQEWLEANGIDSEFHSWNS
ncbi:hypothetical protein WM2015_2873 [Wenzhouxiangella marina]|uniref:Uncharacterized protein n=2 Tax=Wenzhouxiangella marina TaxID=1579979 RepID=A0A0K0XZY9_9GAMM|nr:hypothetical protein WM2015_2873 [Wenzhouxiangella marina]